MSQLSQREVNSKSRWRTEWKLHCLGVFINTVTGMDFFFSLKIFKCQVFTLIYYMHDVGSYRNKLINVYKYKYTNKLSCCLRVTPAGGAPFE